MKKTGKILSIITSILALSAGLLLALYLWIIPALISNSAIHTLAQKILKQSANIELNIVDAELRTSLTPFLGFSVEELSLIKNQEKLLELKEFETVVHFDNLFKKELSLVKVGAEKLFADVNKLISLLPEQEQKKETKPSDWNIYIWDSLFYINDALIIYNPDANSSIRIAGKNIELSDHHNPRFVRFDLSLELMKNGEKLVFAIADKDSVYIQDQKLYAKDCIFNINNSKIFINFLGEKSGEIDLKLHSNGFKIEDIVHILKSDFIIPNGEELLAMFGDINGSFDFKVHIKNDSIDGTMNLHRLFFKFNMLNNIPILLNHGRVHLSGDKILFKGIKGYYGKSSENSIDFNGKIIDYMKTFDTEFIGYVVGTNEFMTDYLSKMIGYPVELIGKTTAKVKVKMLNGIIDSSVIFRLKKGYDLLADGFSLSGTDYERAFRADMRLNGMNFELTNLNYYMADSFTAGVVAKPILRLYGNFDMAKNMEIQNLGFEIPKPLPSEFLNLLIGERIFRRGQISGHLEYLNNGAVPVLKGDLAMNKVLIPSQRLSIRNGKLFTQDGLVNLDFQGRYKRSEYNFNGHIENQIKLPIVVKKINLKLDNIDVARVMQSFNQQSAKADLTNEQMVSNLATTKEEIPETDENMDAVSFNTNLIVIEDCLLEIVKGVYNQINFGNVLATMTLDENGILQINSNKFDIAEGISTAKVFCDLQKQIYKIRLGVKDVDSDKIATSLLNLPREITGKARGLILLETDNTFKLNGLMKFDIKNGSIAKIGLVEYALNFVSLFRNPLSMISPATIMDLVNVPEGTFDKIEGELKLKDNVVQRMVIKSSAPQLASFIAGRYDLENADASLRIYTKFSNKNKGVAGFLRNISLNSLANKVSLSSKNDGNYYAAELAQIPEIQADEKDCQVFLTKVEGDVEHFNFLSSLKRIK